MHQRLTYPLVQKSRESEEGTALFSMLLHVTNYRAIGYLSFVEVT